MKDEGQSKGNIIMVTDGPSIPNPREWRLINAWSIALCGAIITLVLLCTTGPQVYRDAIIFLPDGLLLTFKVTAYSICGAVPLGLLTGLGRISRNRFFQPAGLHLCGSHPRHPLLVQIFYIYFAISMLVKMEGVTSAVIALSFCYGAYMGEVFRAGILVIPTGRPKRPAPWASTACRPCSMWCCPRPGAPSSRPSATNASPCSRIRPWSPSSACPT